MTDPYIIIITLSGLVIVGYLFNVLSHKIHVPSVVMLIASGIIIRIILDGFEFTLPETGFILEILGIMGLIFIVLEGALELELRKEKRRVINRSFWSALLILIATSFGIAGIIQFTWETTFKQAYIFSVPFAVISSSIAIPSVKNLIHNKREFIVYESTFSDILGIMLFNYIILDEAIGFGHIYMFALDLIILIAASVVATLIMLSVLNYSTLGVKFFLVYAILFLLYSVAKIYHLPSLLMVLFFGLAINNIHIYHRGFFARHIKLEKVKKLTVELKLFTEELAFLIRTFFFLIFGYTLNLQLINDSRVIYAGTAIVCSIILVRFIFLKFISKINVYPEIFIAPRGLITILLYYSIPASLNTGVLNDGLLAYVILFSSAVMMVAIMLSGKQYPDNAEPNI